MVQPLALVVYQKLLPGSQIVNRLQDLNFRTETLSDVTQLVETAERCKPMIVLMDLQWRGADAPKAAQLLRTSAATAHLPVIAFGADGDSSLQAAAESAGVTILASEAAINAHLPQLLDRALQV